LNIAPIRSKNVGFAAVCFLWCPSDCGDARATGIPFVGGARLQSGRLAHWGEGSAFEGACAEGSTLETGTWADGNILVGADCAEGVRQLHEGCDAADSIFVGA
jgi:hypothetical protein